MLKRMLTVLGVLLGLMLGFATPAAKAATLPTCDPGVNCLQFGDFNVYSLPLLDLQAGGTGVPGPGSEFFYSSTYGQIQNYTIMGINNGNCTTTGNPPGGADCSYNTPSQSSPGSNIFSTKTAEAGGVADPGGAGQFGGDTENTWDIRTTTLLNLSQGTPLVAFFAFNEDNRSGTGLEGAALLTWVKVTLSGAGGTQDFYLCAGAGCQGNEVNTAPKTLANPLGVPDATSNDVQSAPWVYVHSGICTIGTNFVGFPDADGNCQAGATLREQNNLGQNAAAFMINSPTLDAALNSGQYDVMQVLWKMAHISGGGETAWIEPIRGQQVAEPSTLASFALALVALGFVMRRRPR